VSNRDAAPPVLKQLNKIPELLILPPRAGLVLRIRRKEMGKAPFDLQTGQSANLRHPVVLLRRWAEILSDEALYPP